MEIKIDCKLLSEQINLCDACVERYGADHAIGGLFDGIANLLSEICFAVEEDEDVCFVRSDEV